jgi:uncharacterized protein
MNRPNAFKKNAPLVFLLLTFFISWGLIVLLAGPGNIPINAEKSQDLLPLLYIMMLVGPSASGLLMIGFTNGKKGFRDFWSKLTKWRIGGKWYLFALLSAPVLALVILFVLSVFSPDFRPGFIDAIDKGSFLFSGLLIGLMVGLFEETGWSGFLIPEMRLRHSIFYTGLVVGLIWGAWHFILFWENDSFLGILPLAILITRLFTWLPPFRIFMVWILDRTGSLLLVILTHASLVFTTTVIVPMSLNGTNLLIWLIVWSLVLWVLAIIIPKTHKKGG